MVSSAGLRGYAPPRIREVSGVTLDDVVKNKLSEGNADNRLNDAEKTLLREAE
ncbi:TPA: hypothetical protein QFV83_001053 [Klebsiella aerogenes]|nr:hypothetical protein [Klebsiella aerogenes]